MVKYLTFSKPYTLPKLKRQFSVSFGTLWANFAPTDASGTEKAVIKTKLMMLT